jgi:glycerophosphoryl diester phosphodiesterase
MFPGFMAAAHRGGSLLRANLGRENTLHAFREAARLGYRFLETDVRTTSDRRLVIHHDADLDRTSDGSGLISDLPFAEVRRARVGGIDQIPTLDEALEALPHCRFLVDVKDARGVGPLEETLSRHAAWDRVCVGSFGVTRLARLRHRASGRATTSAGPLEVAVNAFLPRGVGPVPAAYQVPTTWRFGPIRYRVLTPSFIERAHARGAAVHVWTINNASDMHRVLDLGVDGIVTDAIDVARDVLVERGLWEEE